MKFLWLRVNLHVVRHDGLFIQREIGKRLVIMHPLNNRGFTQPCFQRRFQTNLLKICCEAKNLVESPAMAQHRSYKDECSFIERLDENSFLIKKGFVPNMKVSDISSSI